MSHLSSLFYWMHTDHRWLKGVLFLALALCLVAVTITFLAMSIGRPHMGILLSMNERGWAVEMVDANGLASQGGIKKGDKPILVNGQPAETFLEKYRKDGVVFGQLIRELTVANDRGQLKSVALENSPPVFGSEAELTARLVVVITFWIIGFYVFLRKPRNMAALLLLLSALAIGLTIGANAAAVRAIPTAIFFEIIAAIIGPWLLLHFFLILPGERDWLRKNPLLYLIYLPPAITLVLFTLIGYSDGQPLPEFRTLRFFEYGAGFLATVGVMVFNYFRAPSLKTRQQMKIVLFGCLAALIPIVFINLLPQIIGIQPTISPGFSVLFIVFIPLAMGYAVLTQKLMDIDVLIRRSLVYGMIAVVMAAILSVATFPAVTFHESLGFPEQILIVVASGIVATALFGPAKKGIETLVDRLLYKDRYDYRQIINSLSTALNFARDSTDISRLIVNTVVNTLNLNGGCLFTKTQSGSSEVSAAQGTFTNTGRQQQLATLISQSNPRIEFPNSASTADLDVLFLIPLVAGEKKVGTLCLSHKASRQGFSSDDIYLLQGLSSVAAIALHSAMLSRDVNARDTFISIASHELRTPLTSIMGYTDLLLRRGPSDANIKRWLNKIFDSGQRITDMVDDLLNVSRIQSGKVNIKLERVKLSDIIEETLSITRESTNKHQFVVDIELDLPDLLVDRDKFGQVVGNLLSNAVKYSPNGGCVTLSAHNDLQRHRIVVSVADEGIGISPADKSSLFTTFHRIQRPETQGIRGSGLGLYIAKEWTEAMGGEIWLECELNKGSTFFVAIPTQNSNGTG